MKILRFILLITVVVLLVEGNRRRGRNFNNRHQSAIQRGRSAPISHGGRIAKSRGRSKMMNVAYDSPGRSHRVSGRRGQSPGQSKYISRSQTQLYGNGRMNHGRDEGSQHVLITGRGVGRGRGEIRG